MNAALKMVPSPVNDRRADIAEDFLSDIVKIGVAWNAALGRDEGEDLRLLKPRGSRQWFAIWNRTGPQGSGDCMADAALALAREFATDLREWSKEEDADLAPMLEASLAPLQIKAVTK